MRLKITLIIVIAAMTLSGIARAERRYDDKDFAKIIEQYDVADTVMHAPTAGDFWLLLQSTDDRYRKISKSLGSNGDRDLKHDLIETLSNCDAYFRNVPTCNDLYDLSESLVEASGLRAINPLAILSFTQESDIAAFGYPNGYIFMTRPLYDQVGGSRTDLQGLLAAEGAHYALQHAYGHAKWEKSRRNRRRWARILGAIGITTAGIILEDQSQGVFPGTEIGLMVGTAMVMSDTPARYNMQYTPKQIFEADIIAYRFMEWLGKGGRSYINTLRLAGYHIDAANYQGADCPTVAQRIALLEYLEAHPELRQHTKAAKRRPKYVPHHFSIFEPRNYR